MLDSCVYRPVRPFKCKATRSRPHSSFAAFGAIPFSVRSISTIEIACQRFCVQVVGTNEGDARLAWDRALGGELRLRRGDGILRIMEEKQPSGTGLCQRQDICLMLPEDYRGALRVETAQGDIAISNLAIAGDVQLKTTAGCIEVVRVTAGGSFDAQCAEGVLSIRAMTSNAPVRLLSASGAMKISDLRAGSSFAATSVSGNLMFDELFTKAQCSIISGGGSIQADAVRAETIQIATAGAGEIRSHRLYADKVIDIAAEAGQVVCQIDGQAAEYRTCCHSAQGKAPLAEGCKNAKKQLFVRTLSGDAHLHFLI